MLSRVMLAALATLISVVPVAASDDLLERLATCQDSWYESRDDGAAMKNLADTFNSAFRRDDKKHSFVPKGRVAVAGLPVVQAFPQSAGMGVGFSLVVEAEFEKAKAAIEKTIGKALTDCETGDGMRTCGLEVAPKRTIMLVAGESSTNRNSLVGCYFYEK